MSYLSEALKKYYKRQGQKVLFSNKLTLNQLALSMYESLGFHQIDASVISRVINGERLFTSQQLQAFCNILDINKHEEQNLFFCLSEDYNTKKKVEINIFSISPSTIHEVTKSLIDSGFKLLYEGNCSELEQRCNLIEVLTKQVTLKSQSDASKSKLYELIALNMYLKGRVIGSIRLPQTVVKETIAISNRLIELGTEYKNKKMYAYAHILLSNAYYVKGGYTKDKTTSKFFNQAIELGNAAISNLEYDDHERQFALRTMIASASYISDHETVNRIHQMTKQILSMQPIENRVNTLHLCGTVAKALTMYKTPDPFSLREKAVEYFHDDLSNTRIYEISDIKTEIEALIALKSNDKKYMLGKIKRGLEIANKNNFIRHQEFLENLSRTL